MKIDQVALKDVERQIAELEAAHPGQISWEPWNCNDDSLALEHWGLVQRRINLAHGWTDKPAKTVKKRAEWTPERKKAAGDRFKAMWKAKKAQEQAIP